MLTHTSPPSASRASRSSARSTCGASARAVGAGTPSAASAAARSGARKAATRATRCRRSVRAPTPRARLIASAARAMALPASMAWPRSAFSHTSARQGPWPWWWYWSVIVGLLVVVWPHRHGRSCAARRTGDARFRCPACTPCRRGGVPGAACGAAKGRCRTSSAGRAARAPRRVPRECVRRSWPASRTLPCLNVTPRRAPGGKAVAGPGGGGVRCALACSVGHPHHRCRSRPDVLSVARRTFAPRNRRSLETRLGAPRITSGRRGERHVRRFHVSPSPVTRVTKARFLRRWPRATQG